MRTVELILVIIAGILALLSLADWPIRGRLVTVAVVLLALAMALFLGHVRN